LDFLIWKQVQQREAEAEEKKKKRSETFQDEFELPGFEESAESIRSKRFIVMKNLSLQETERETGRILNSELLTHELDDFGNSFLLVHHKRSSVKSAKLRNVRQQEFDKMLLFPLH
jgi:hypothetical protein